MISQRKQHCWKGMCVGGKGLHIRQTAIPSGSCRLRRAEEDPCEQVSVLHLQQNAALLTSWVLWRMWIPSDIRVWFLRAGCTMHGWASGVQRGWSSRSSGLCSPRQTSAACFFLFPFANTCVDCIQHAACTMPVKPGKCFQSPMGSACGTTMQLEEPWATSS